MKPLLFLVRYILSFWNPRPKKWKQRWPDGRPVLDIRQRKQNKQFTDAEIARRQENGEGENKCYKIHSKSSISFAGSAE